MNDLIYKLKRLIMARIANIQVLLVLDDIYRIVSMPFAFVVYVVTTRLLRRPYFGVWMVSGQGNPLRFPYMRAAVAACAVERRKSDPDEVFKVLEIGAYAGASAIQFSTALTEVGGPFQVYSVDPWDAYLDLTRNNRVHCRLMNYNLANGNVLRLFVRNVRAAGMSAVCRQFRGKAEEVLPMLREGLFDFIYVDADHAPDAVRRDLRESARLLKPGGYLAGDDLEMQMAELDPAFVAQHAEEDIALDPASGRVFHPGVAIAVHEFFGRKITSYDGFWVVRWTGETYEDVLLDS